MTFRKMLTLQGEKKKRMAGWKDKENSNLICNISSHKQLVANFHLLSRQRYFIKKKMKFWIGEDF